MLRPLLPLADYNVAGPLNALLKPIQGLDTESEYGKRSIFFTKQPELLQGFQLNQRNQFDQIVRNPVFCTISKNDGSAKIDLPSLMPGINFFVPGKFPFFGFTVVLGVLPGLAFHSDRYLPVEKYEMTFPAMEQTEWHLVSKGAAAQSVQLSIKTPMPNQSFCLMLSVGIRFGNPGLDRVEQVKYAGAGKILMVI